MAPILDLPDLVLDRILERLEPPELLNMTEVCTYLRSKCRSDHLWQNHMNRKWRKVIGEAAQREWQWFVESKCYCRSSKAGKRRGLVMRLASLIRDSIPWIIGRVKEIKDCSKLESETTTNIQYSPPPPDDSIMYWYLALETGKFHFPAQVYNRENGHIGFTLSCYDAELSYDPQTDTFKARYPPYGIREISTETGIKWERIRPSPVNTLPHDLHVSDCLVNLRPNDHIEIQWRRNKEFPYGWWYGNVGHTESCDRNEPYCSCHNNETVVLEFRQYSHESHWRRATVNRRTHREKGNEAYGFYGGIRKLSSDEEIFRWKELWPNQLLD